jgi:hypothetical protein
MRTLNNIDIIKSIDSKKLQYDKGWGEYFDALIFPVAIIFGFVVCPLLILFFEIDLNNPNEKFIGYTVLPLVIIIGSNLAIRKITELHLKTIPTTFNEQDTFDSIILFSENENYKIRRKSNYCIVMDQFKDDSKFARTVVLFITDNKLYFTMIQDNFKINTPTFISHILFKRNLKRWLENNAGNSVQAPAHELASTDEVSSAAKQK